MGWGLGSNQSGSNQKATEQSSKASTRASKQASKQASKRAGKQARKQAGQGAQGSGVAAGQTVSIEAVGSPETGAWRATTNNFGRGPGSRAHVSCLRNPYQQGLRWRGQHRQGPSSYPWSHYTNMSGPLPAGAPTASKGCCPVQALPPLLLSFRPRSHALTINAPCSYLGSSGGVLSWATPGRHGAWPSGSFRSGRHCVRCGTSESCEAKQVGAGFQEDFGVPRCRHVHADGCPADARRTRQQRREHQQEALGEGQRAVD